jgi:molybdopterin/thiamine biosynthesis adenylyltransferase
MNLFLHDPGATACFECRKIQAQQQTPWYQTLTDYGRTVVDERDLNPCTAPVAGLIGNLAALETMKYLTGLCESAIYGRRLTVDLRTFESWTSAGERQPSCPVCAGLPDRTGGASWPRVS